MSPLHLRYRLLYTKHIVYRTIHHIHKFLKRKTKPVAKRALVGVFGIRDLGKFKKYQRKLDSIAFSLEVKSNYDSL